MPKPNEQPAGGAERIIVSAPLLTRTYGFVRVDYCPSQFRPFNDGDASRVTNEEDIGDDADGSGLQTYRVLEPTL